MTKDKKGTTDVTDVKDVPVKVVGRKKASWSISSIGTLMVVYPTGMKGNWNMRDIFPDWEDLPNPAKHVAQYGAKQLLSDSIAGMKEPNINMLNEKWKEILEGRTRTGVSKVGQKVMKSAEEKLEKDEAAELARLLKKAGFVL